jgi:hypothetical protein
MRKSRLNHRGNRARIRIRHLEQPLTTSAFPASPRLRRTGRRHKVHKEDKDKPLLPRRYGERGGAAAITQGRSPRPFGLRGRSGGREKVFSFSRLPDRPRAVMALTDLTSCSSCATPPFKFFTEGGTTPMILSGKKSLKAGWPR